MISEAIAAILSILCITSGNAADAQKPAIEDIEPKVKCEERLHKDYMIGEEPQDKPEDVIYDILNK